MNEEHQKGVEAIFQKYPWLKEIKREKRSITIPDGIYIFPGYNWYDGYIGGLCTFNGVDTDGGFIRYFHWMEGGSGSGPTYQPRIYYVYNIDYVPVIDGWEDLSKYPLIGKFSENDILGEAPG